jgi:hypothetical protein
MDHYLGSRQVDEPYKRPWLSEPELIERLASATAGWSLTSKVACGFDRPVL